MSDLISFSNTKFSCVTVTLGTCTKEKRELFLTFLKKLHCSNIGITAGDFTAYKDLGFCWIHSW